MDPGSPKRYGEMASAAPTRSVEPVPIGSFAAGDSRRSSNDADYVLIAKRIPACNRNREVSDKTRCIVLDPCGKYKYMSWRQIKDLKHTRVWLEDWGHGVHPAVDQTFLREFKLKPGNYHVEDAIMWDTDIGNYEITVFLTLTDAAVSKSLQDRREATKYHYSGPLRCCPTVFVRAGGAESDYTVILEQRQPQTFLEKTRRAIESKQSLQRKHTLTSRKGGKRSRLHVPTRSLPYT